MTIVLGATLLIGLILRILVLNQSLWHDEAIGALVTRNNSFIGIITNYIRFDNHPPLYYLSLKSWVNLFGSSEVGLRMLSVLFGVGTLMVLYLVAKKIFKNRKIETIIPVFLLAISPLHLYFSQEVRMYAMAAFFAALAFYAFLLTLEGKNKGWILFSVSILLMLFSDYMPIFLLPVFWLYGLIKIRNKKWWLLFVLSHTPLLIAGLIWLPIFMSQAKNMSALASNFPAWKMVVGGVTPKSLFLLPVKLVLGRISFDNKPFYYILIIASSIPYFFLFLKAFGVIKKHLLIWLAVVVPVALAFLLSFVVPVFNYFRFIFIIPFFCLLLAVGIVEIKNKKGKIAALTVLTFISLSSWMYFVFTPKLHREDWRSAVKTVEEKIKTDEIVLFDFPEILPGYDWYAKDTSNVRLAVPGFIDQDKLIVQQTNRMIAGKSGIYYFEYLRDLADPNRVAEQTIEKAGFVKKTVFDGFSGGAGQVTYFSRP
jgi:uncharacterized membrane protein